MVFKGREATIRIERIDNTVTTPLDTPIFEVTC